MDHWDESVEILKAIDCHNDLNKGPVQSLLRKIFGKLFGSSSKSRIPEKSNLYSIKSGARIDPNLGKKSDKRSLQEKKFRDDYRAGQELIDRNDKNAKLTFDQEMAVKHKGILPENPDFDLPPVQSQKKPPTNPPKITYRRLDRKEIESRREMEAASRKKRAAKSNIPDWKRKMDVAEDNMLRQSQKKEKTDTTPRPRINPKIKQ